MRWMIAILLSGVVLSESALPQENSTTQAAQTRFYQSQVFSSQANTGISGNSQTGSTQGVPYYVDPSRFYYNRPGASGMNSNAAGSNSVQGPTYNIYVRPGFYYQGFYPYWRRGYGYGRYFGPQVYYPRVYQIAPGVTEHVGPFIPIIP